MYVASELGSVGTRFSKPPQNNRAEYGYLADRCLPRRSSEFGGGAAGGDLPPSECAIRESLGVLPCPQVMVTTYINLTISRVNLGHSTTFSNLQYPV